MPRTLCFCCGEPCSDCHGRKGRAGTGRITRPSGGWEFSWDDPDDEAANRQSPELVMNAVEYLRSIQRAG